MRKPLSGWWRLQTAELEEPAEMIYDGGPNTQTQTSSHLTNLFFRIQDFAAGESELPNHQVSRLVDAAQQRRVEVGKSQICDGPPEPLQQGALVKVQAQNPNHGVVIGS